MCIDTWRCVKPPAVGRGSAYDDDARAIHPLHLLAMRNPGLCILLIHHTRKMVADDPFATISGTYGLTGVADTLLVLARHGEGHKLCVQGRDLDNAEKALQRDCQTGGWRMTGEAQQFAKTLQRQQVLDVLAQADCAVLRTGQIASAIGKNPDTTNRLLTSLMSEGKVKKEGYGEWSLENSHSNHSNCSK